MRLSRLLKKTQMPIALSIVGGCAQSLFRQLVQTVPMVQVVQAVKTRLSDPTCLNNPLTNFIQRAAMRAR